MAPDRVIVRELKDHDPDLYVKWNRVKCFYEVWRKRLFKEDLLVTPVVHSIYNPSAPRVFAPFDERILWWIQDADTWYHGKKETLLKFDSRWIDWHRKRRKNRRDDIIHRAKEMWTGLNNRYATQHASKNKRLTRFNSCRTKSD